MCNSFSHKFRFLSSALTVASGTGFLIYSTYVTNNLQIPGEEWLNSTYYEHYGQVASTEQVTMLWACVIAAKEVGKILGTILLPVVAERCGRRSGLLINCVCTVIGCLLCLFGKHSHYSVIMFGRVILGVTMIVGVGLASLFLIEVAPMKQRGKSGSFIQIFRGLGGTMGMALALPQLLGTTDLWTVCLAVPAIPATAQFIILLFCEESPRHLYITKHDIAGATKAVHFYQGRPQTEAVLNDLRREQERITSQSKITCANLFTRTDFWKPMLLTTLALTNRSLAGILLVQSYSTDMFMSAGVQRNTAAISTVGLGLCHLFSATLVTFTVDRFGRKPMLIAGNLGCLLTLSMVALFASNPHLPLASVMTVLSLWAFMLIYPVVASVSNIVASEICHQKMRSLAFTIGLLVYSCVGLLSTFAYPLLKRYIGIAASFMPFCASLIICSLIYAKYLPETKGKTFESLAFGENKAASRTLLNADCAEPLLSGSADSLDVVDSNAGGGTPLDNDDGDVDTMVNGRITDNTML